LREGGRLEGVDDDGGGGDVQLEVKLSSLKAEHRRNEQILREQDRQIRYLKQQLSLKASGIAANPGASPSTHKMREKICVDRKALEKEYRKMSKKGKLKTGEFKAFLTNIGFKKAQMLPSVYLKPLI
jgi:hypothetical protein